jgi:hypothetical protein
VDVGGHKVELRTNAGALRVRDAKVSDKDRNEIQTNMIGPDVLDAERYKEIGFRSTGAEAAGAGAWKEARKEDEKDWAVGYRKFSSSIRSDSWRSA